MRTLSKSSTAKCTLEHYTAFLLAEAQSAGCVRLAEISGGEFAHDAANCFLNREEFNPKDLFFGDPSAHPPGRGHPERG
jgi:hypothetical protein